MTEYEIELIKMIRNSNDSEKVANYMLNLFLDYLRTHAPYREKTSAVLSESD